MLQLSSGDMLGSFGIEGQAESPQVGRSRSANTAQRLNSVNVVPSSD